MSYKFEFIDPGTIVRENIQLVLTDTSSNDPEMNCCPCYFFNIVEPVSGKKMGELRMRIGDGHKELKYLGHLGYNTEVQFRGNRLAVKSVQMIMPFAAKNGLDSLWINCDKNNLASLRTCHLLGAVHHDTVSVPPDDPVFRDGIKTLCRHNLVIFQE